MKFYHFSFMSDGGSVGSQTLPVDEFCRAAIEKVVSLIRQEGGRFVLSTSEDRRSLIDRRRTSLVCDFTFNGREEKLSIGSEWDDSLSPLFQEAPTPAASDLSSQSAQ